MIELHKKAAQFTEKQFPGNPVFRGNPETNSQREAGSPDYRRNLPRRPSVILQILLGSGGGLRDYDRRRRNMVNQPKPMASSERAEGSGTPLIVIPEFGMELKAAS